MNLILFKLLEPYQFDKIFYFKLPWEVKLTLVSYIEIDYFLLLNSSSVSKGQVLPVSYH